MSFFAGCGSRPSDIPSNKLATNPLPPCPDSPNCIRITKEINTPVDTAFAASVEALKIMEPEQTSISKQHHKIETVFKVFVFRDDMVIQVTEDAGESSLLHIRSASRIGKSDLGVNTRRVKTFLEQFQTELK